jgi:hypothetical protein
MPGRLGVGAVLCDRLLLAPTLDPTPPARALGHPAVPVLPPTVGQCQAVNAHEVASASIVRCQMDRHAAEQNLCSQGNPRRSAVARLSTSAAADALPAPQFEQILTTPAPSARPTGTARAGAG